MRNKAELRNILFRYLDEYYREFPEEKGNYPNWGELEWDDRYPDVFPALYGCGDLSQKETDELNNFADKVYDAWRKLNESTKNNRHIESKLAENFANELKNLQKEGLFENVSSFDLDFTGRGINIKLNEMAYKDDYEEYNERGKDYRNYEKRTKRQEDTILTKMYQLKPVSFTFNNETFTLKNTKVYQEYKFDPLSYEVKVMNSSSLLHTFNISSWYINTDTDKFSSVESALDYKFNVDHRLHQEAKKVYNQTSIRHKDQEAFTEAFGEAVIEFIQPLLSRPAFLSDLNSKFHSTQKNRYNKIKSAKYDVDVARYNAYGSWRKEHFGIEGYEVGQTVEIIDGRNGNVRHIGKIIKMTPSGTATIQLEDGTTIVRRNVEDDKHIFLFKPLKKRDPVYDENDMDLVDPSTSTEDAIAARKKAIGLE